MKIKNKRKVWIAAILVLITAIAACGFVYIGQEKIADFLSKNEAKEADILIVEGWLPDFGIKVASDEFKNNDYRLIVTNGLKSPDLDFFTLGMNGFLIFYPDPGSMRKEKNQHHLIEILAHSKMSEKYCSHFNFYVNDSLIADFTADQKRRKYAVNWNGQLKDIDSLMVQFDDDYMDEGGVRDLFVKEIIIDNKIFIPYQFNSVYDIGKLGGDNIIVNDYESHAELARNRLISTGIDSSSVIAVKGKRTEFNRTLTSALTFHKWFNSYNGGAKSINIITLGIHSRRTWMTYKSILDKSLEIGIISLPETDKPGFEKIHYSDILGEVFSLIYYQIILIPFLLF